LLALEIFVNGRKVSLAGAEDISVLTGIVNAVGKLGKKTSKGKETHAKGYDLWLTVGGLTDRADGTPNEHLRWVGHKKLKIGDRVEIRVRKATTADSPIESTPAESKEQERFQYKWAKSQYMKLRKKYEKPRANKLVKRTR
jgi:hypothetical protein